MDVSYERVGMRWDCPLREVEVPGHVVYRALLSLRHGADRPADEVAAVLAPVAGPARRGLMGRLTFRDGHHDLQVRIRRDRLEVRSRHRLRPRALQRVVAALAKIPGAHDLELHAEVPRFSQPYSGLRACSPCQARRF